MDFTTFIYILSIGLYIFISSINIQDFINKICKFVLWIYQFKVEIENKEIENLPTKLIMVSSHTSIYDFLFSYMVYKIYFSEKYIFELVMKRRYEENITEICKRIEPKMDIIPIEEKDEKGNKEKKENENIKWRGGEGMTQQIIDYLKNKDNYILGIAPEGTRKCVDKIRSGYYHIGKELDVEVIYMGIDYKKRIIRMEKIHRIEDSWEKEEGWFIENCKKYTPLFPERCFWNRDEYLEEWKKELS